MLTVALQGPSPLPVSRETALLLVHADWAKVAVAAS